MHKPLKEEAIEAMAMMMLGVNAVFHHNDHKQGIGKEARKKKKAKHRQQKQSRRCRR